MQGRSEATAGVHRQGLIGAGVGPLGQEADEGHMRKEQDVSEEQLPTTRMRHDERLHDGVHYPTSHLLAVLRDPQASEQAAQALRAAGFVDVEVVSGQQALRAIEVTEQQESPLRRSWERLSQVLSDEADARPEYLEALGQGLAVLLVYAPHRALVDQAADILKAHQAHAIRFFGRWTITELEP